MFFAHEVWCIADVSSISPSSEQTEILWGNQRLNSEVFINTDQEIRSCHWLEFASSNWSTTTTIFLFTLALQLISTKF